MWIYDYTSINLMSYLLFQAVIEDDVTKCFTAEGLYVVNNLDTDFVQVCFV